MIVTVLAALLAAASVRAETIVHAAGPSGPLEGTMLAPASAAHAPMVLIIPGSGPTNRDGNNMSGLTAAPYRLLAEALADRGIASIRIDKRGMYGSAAAVSDPNAVTIPDYAADVKAWTASLIRSTGAPCVWVLGHSEGALVAEVAVQDDPNACGLIMVSGIGRRSGDVIRQQLEANPAYAQILPNALAAISTLEAGKHVEASALNPALLPLFRPAVQDFVISEFALDPAELIKRDKGPILILQGTTDLQVSVVDAERLAAARPDAKFVKLEGVNHVLKTAPMERAANLATYANPSLPLAPGVADAVADFVKANAKRPSGKG